MYVWLLVVVASRNYALLNSVRSCTHRLTVIRVQQLLSSNDKEADRCRHEQGCAHIIGIGQPLIIDASGNHPVLDGVAALIPWLVSCIQLHFYLVITHVRCCGGIPTCGAVDCIPERYRQN